MSTLSKLSISLFLTFFMALTSFSAEARNITEWNLGQANLAIQGYDPVAYFPEGGGEAAFGGWCATAMSMGQKIVIIPERFIVKGNRLFLFSFLNGNDAKFMWEQNPAGMERRADFNWKKISDEDPRGK